VLLRTSSRASRIIRTILPSLIRPSPTNRLCLLISRVRPLRVNR
jgi:hypothetical protein